MTPAQLSALALVAAFSAPAAVVAFEPSGLLEIHYINPQGQAGVTLVIGRDGSGPNSQGNRGREVVDEILCLGAGCPCLDSVRLALVLQIDESAPHWGTWRWCMIHQQVTSQTPNRPEKAE